jgi:LacI family transcriptional regulator
VSSGVRRVTIRDVAAAAGVQPSTVSKALHHDRGSPEVRRRVAEAAARLGYRPDERASGLRRARSRALGLLVPDLANPVYLPFLRGVEQAAQERGYVVLIADGQRSREVERAALDRFFAQGADGILLAGPVDPDVLGVFVDHGVPVVPQGSGDPLAWDAGEATATGHMADRLLALGHRSFLLVITAARGRPPTARYGRSRYAALADRVRADGGSLGVHVVDPARGEADGVSALAGALAAGAATALVCGSHLLAPWLLLALDRAGLRVPQDRSLVVYGDSDWARAHRPPLDVVAFDRFTQGRALAAELLDRVGGAGAVEAYSWEAQDVARGSSGPPLSR